MSIVEVMNSSDDSSSQRLLLYDVGNLVVVFEAWTGLRVFVMYRHIVNKLNSKRCLCKVGC